MKLKAINVVIVAFGLSLPFATIAVTTESTTTNVGSQVTDLSQPNKSDNAILEWASATAVATCSYDSKNYRDEIQKLSGSFTDSGWSKFMDALNKSKNLDAVKNKQLTVSAVVTSAPIILQKGVLNNVYSWKVQMPMIVTYQSANEVSKQNNIVTMSITRTSSVNAPTGIAVNQILISPASGENNSNATVQKATQ